MGVTRHEVTAAYRAVFDREPEPAVVDDWQARAGDLETLLRALLASRNPRQAAPVEDYRRSREYLDHTGARFGVPRELSVTPTPLKRVLLVGQCLLSSWPHLLKRNGVDAEIDHVLLGVNDFPVLPHPTSAYSFQVAQIGNRYFFHDRDLLAWLRLPYGDEARAEAMFKRACDGIDRGLKFSTALRDAMPVFVTNFPRPQQELNGRLIPRRDLSSIFEFYDRLNAYLRAAVDSMENVYILDVVEIFAMIGRRHLQDDSLTISSHGSWAGNAMIDRDAGRIVPVRKPSEYYEFKAEEFVVAVWNEAEAMYRSLRRIDEVKMLCVDLDDTLWRGVLAEAADIADIDAYHATEGWPLGLVEALLTLKRRGVLLCLISKNDEARVRAIFAHVYRNKLAIEDFAILKINWRSKAENVAEAMAQANLLPRSVVFLDDNPVERATVKQAFPDLRVIEAPLYYWRRILLWSAETQVATITAESARRTEMVQAQVQREALRSTVDHEDFLAGLGLRVDLARVAAEGPRFARALELLNKSNQFNTTGRRWTAQELAQAAQEGMLIAASVSDRFTDYGDTLIAVTRGERIEQIVMSCRVIGLGVELAAVAAIAGRVLALHPIAVAAIVETDANVLARDLFARCGWSHADGEWRTTAANAAPAHIALGGL